MVGCTNPFLVDRREPTQTFSNCHDSITWFMMNWDCTRAGVCIRKWSERPNKQFIGRQASKAHIARHLSATIFSLTFDRQTTKNMSSGHRPVSVQSAKLANHQTTENTPSPLYDSVPPGPSNQVGVHQSESCLVCWPVLTPWRREPT